MKPDLEGWQLLKSPEKSYGLNHVRCIDKEYISILRGLNKHSLRYIKKLKTHSCQIAPLAHFKRKQFFRSAKIHLIRLSVILQQFTDVCHFFEEYLREVTSNCVPCKLQP